MGLGQTPPPSMGKIPTFYRFFSGGPPSLPSKALEYLHKTFIWGTFVLSKPFKFVTGKKCLFVILGLIYSIHLLLGNLGSNLWFQNPGDQIFYFPKILFASSPDIFCLRRAFFCSTAVVFLFSWKIIDAQWRPDSHANVFFNQFLFIPAELLRLLSQSRNHI